MDWSKQIVSTMIILVMFATGAHAQTFSEWFRQKKTQIAYYTEQIAALKAYNDLLLDGYHIVRDGLQAAHDLRKGEFDLHYDYFQSLRLVNLALKTDETSHLYNELLQQCDAARAITARLPRSQQQYVLAVIHGLQEKAYARYREYEILVEDEQYQLADDDRLRRINMTTNALHEQYTFVKRLYFGLQKMILQGARETNDARALHKLFEP